MQSLRESYALLDAVGWSKTDPPVAVPLDLGENDWALMRALDSAQELAGEEVYEVSRDKNKVQAPKAGFLTVVVDADEYEYE